MALHKIKDFAPDYRETFEGHDIKGMDVYTDRPDEKIGTVSDVLVDDQGHFRYLVIDLGFWIFGKKVLLPIGRARIDYTAGRVHALEMTRQQAENLPQYNEHDNLDYDYEERVRGVYRNPRDYTQPQQLEAPLDTLTPLEAPMAPNTIAQPSPLTEPASHRDTYHYDQEPSLFGLNDQAHPTLKLYQERLIASKQRHKSGEVTIGKHIETDTARISVPVDRERVVVERVTPDDAGRTVAPGEANFHEGEVTRVELYEETANIQKEAFVREEVIVTKVVDHETFEAQDTVRREELDVNSPGLPIDEH